MEEALIFKFVKFGLVGSSGLVVDFGTTYLSKEILSIQKYVANSFGFILAASSNYVLNRVWTFASTDPEVLIQYGKFIAIALIGLGLNNFFLYIIHQRMEWSFYWAKLIAIGLVVFWNFFANYYFTF